MRFVVIGIIAAYLLLLLLLNLPLTRRGLCSLTESMLGDALHTEVSIGDIEIGLFNRATLSEVQIMDQQGDTLLQAERLSTKIALRSLWRSPLTLRTVSLIGANIRLYRANETAPLNAQFVIDAFKSEDDTNKKPLDLRIGSLILRRCTISYDEHFQPRTPSRFNPSHMAFSNIDASISVRRITDNSINLRLRSLSMEEQCGLKIENLTAKLESAHQGEAQLKESKLLLRDLTLTLPHSRIAVEELPFYYDGSSHIGHTLQTLRTEGRWKVARVAVQDLASFIPDAHAATCPWVIGLSGGFSVTPETIALHDFALQEQTNDLFHIAGEISLRKSEEGLRKIYAHLKDFSLRPELFTTNTAPYPALPEKLQQIGAGLGVIQGHVNGEYDFLAQQADVETTLNTLQGDVSATVRAEHLNKAWKVAGKADVKRLALAALLGNDEVPTNISTNAEFSFTTAPDFFAWPAATLNCALQNMEWRGYTYHDLVAEVNKQGEKWILAANSEKDPNLLFNLSGEALLRNGFSLQGLEISSLDAAIKSFAPAALHLTDCLGTTPITAQVHATSEKCSIKSTLVDAEYAGSLIPTALIAEGKRTAAQLFPSLGLDVPPTTGVEATEFSLIVHPCAPLEALIGKSPRIISPMHIEGRVQGEEHSTMRFTAATDFLEVGGDTLTGITLYAQTDTIGGNLLVQGHKKLAGNWTSVEGNIRIIPDEASDSTYIRAHFSAAPTAQPQALSEIAANAFVSLAKGRAGIRTTLLPTTIRLGDNDAWDIVGGDVRVNEKHTSVRNLTVQRPDASARLAVNGDLSGADEDSIVAKLHRIDVGYIMNLVDFHAVDFSGEATGTAVVRGSLKQPIVNADITLPNLFLNGSTIGQAHVTGGFVAAEKKILLNALLDETETTLREHPTAAPMEQNFLKPAHSEVHGYVSLLEKGLHLDVTADCLRLDFIDRYVDGIFEDFSARATGHVLLYGPFKQLHFSGKADATAHARIPSTGVAYDITSGHVDLTPQAFTFTDCHVQSAQGMDVRHVAPEKSYAIANGVLSHTFLKNICYDFTLNAEDLLLYKQGRTMDMPFYATAYGSGTARLHGSPGQFTADLNVTPTQGTDFTYLVDAPSTSGDVQMIEFGVKGPQPHAATQSLSTSAHSPETSEPAAESKTDIRLNFNLDLNTSAAVRLITDEKTGDNMVLYGTGPMRASFYNKGAFTMYGTFRVSRGTYSMQLQDIIRKDLTMRDGSTLTFSGPPMDGALNLTAAYTVPAASLTDLSYGAGFSKRSVRVDCLLNIGGKPTAPRVTFDLDIQGISEEEQQMVRQLLATEDDINRQAVYLLGIGRFFPTSSASLTANPTALNPGASAASSLLSSTISSQLNHALRSALGSASGQWSFGTSFNTGELGWNDIEVDGQLQGSLFNERLLIGGKFGYRENTYTTSNFVGDFDLQYLLTSSGRISLKAYSETNDRYFTRTSLTTQGIGLLLRRDFTNISDLFKPQKKLKTKTETK